MPFSSSVCLKFACTINLLLFLLAAIIPWSLQTNLVVVSWAFSEPVVSSCFMSIALFTFTFSNTHTDILSTCTARTFLSFRCPLPCRSFVGYSPLLIVIWSFSLFSVLSLVHHSPCLASPLFLWFLISISIFLLIQHHLYLIIFLSRAIFWFYLN